jgi:hypothetical protein
MIAGCPDRGHRPTGGPVRRYRFSQARRGRVIVGALPESHVNPKMKAQVEGPGQQSAKCVLLSGSSPGQPLNPVHSILTYKYVTPSYNMLSFLIEKYF